MELINGTLYFCTIYRRPVLAKYYDKIPRPTASGDCLLYINQFGVVNGLEYASSSFRDSILRGDIIIHCEVEEKYSDSSLENFKNAYPEYFI